MLEIERIEFWNSNPENEIWKPVVGFESSYEVSSIGRVRSKTRLIKKKKGIGAVFPSKYFKFRKDSHGYYKVVFNHEGERKNTMIHRVVAEAFLDNPNNYPVVNHINGVKTDNRVENLEWCTFEHNSNHAIEIGLKKTKYSHEFRRNVYLDFMNGINYDIIEMKYSIDRKYIYSIISRFRLKANREHLSQLEKSEKTFCREVKLKNQNNDKNSKTDQENQA